MVCLTDTLDATTTARICADGSLVADVKAARVGIQTYLRSETDAPASFTADQVRVYRPEDEVFSRDSMASFAAAPFTIDHPTAPVDASNWRDLGVGEVNGDVVRDGGFVRVPVIVRDGAAVEKVCTTHKQLSMGYSCTLDWTPGTTPEGHAYDAVQRNIRINHIAAVRAARGGPELKISDERPRNPSTGDNQMKTLTIDGLKVPNVSDEAEAAIIKLQADKAAADAKAKAAEDKSVADAAAMVAKDAEIADLRAKLSDAAITPAKLADAAKEYADVQAKAKAVGVTVAADADTAAIKKAVVDAKMGEKAKAYTADHIAIAFDSLTAGVKVDDAAPNRGVQPIGAPIIANDGATTVKSARAQWLADKATAYRPSAA